MKFSEKLRMLRKEKNLSQEELANLLNVSRQSVSKWESEQAYPEMEKLIQLCKIFDCKLDDLTNDKVDEEKLKQNKKSNIDIVVSYVVDFVNDSINAFKNMSLRDFVRLALEMLLVCVCIAIIKIPVGYINVAVENVLLNFGKAGQFFVNLWDSLLSLGSLIFVFIVLFYSFKRRCVDIYADKKETINAEKVEEVKTGEVKEEKTEQSPALTSFMSIVLILIKILVVIISIPALISIIFFAFAFGMSIVMLFEGIYYFFIPLGIMGCLFLNGIYIDLVASFVASKKISIKRIFISFGLSILCFVLAATIGVKEISNTKYIDYIKDEYKTEITTKTEVFDMQDDLMIHGYKEYIPDDKLNDKVRVEISYYDAYTSAKIAKNEGNIYIQDISLENDQIKRFINVVKQSFKEKELFDYSELFRVNVKVYASHENIEKMKAYEESLYEQELEEQMNDIEKALDEQETVNENLSEENERLKEENQELKEKINEIKSLAE